ncbi:hypothetical protein [Streptomyces mirabilis]|uniref:hypothetical protein n=1 Tax=Streptomyces mirabilis TaxID=68239 RepID=UPI003332EACD
MIQLHRGYLQDMRLMAGRGEDRLQLGARNRFTAASLHADEGREPHELATFVVAVNQSLAVLSRAGASDTELRAVARLTCQTVADTLRATPEHAAWD